MRSALLALALLAGCRHVNRATLAVSTAALAADWQFTRRSAAGGWRCPGGDRPLRESNAVLGTTPSASSVDLYFAVVVAANVAAWLVTPERYRSVVPVAVTAIELDAITYNSGTADRYCR